MVQKVHFSPCKLFIFYMQIIQTVLKENGCFFLQALWHAIKKQQGIYHLLGVGEKVKDPWKPKAKQV